MKSTVDERGKKQKAKAGSLNRQYLLKLEKKEKTRLGKIIDTIILLLPFICGGIAVFEYTAIPNKTANPFPYRYTAFLCILICLYALFVLVSIVKNNLGDFTFLAKARYLAPLYSAVFCF